MIPSIGIIISLYILARYAEMFKVNVGMGTKTFIVLFAIITFFIMVSSFMGTHEPAAIGG
jgi:hypothetical protein